VIGGVVAVVERSGRQQQIGKAQAWHDPADGMLLLWEAFL